jgi:hypothetical protein
MKYSDVRDHILIRSNDPLVKCFANKEYTGEDEDIYFSLQILHLINPKDATLLRFMGIYVAQRVSNAEYLLAMKLDKDEVFPCPRDYSAAFEMVSNLFHKTNVPLKFFNISIKTIGSIFKEHEKSEVEQYLISGRDDVVRKMARKALRRIKIYNQLYAKAGMTFDSFDQCVDAMATRERAEALAAYKATAKGKKAGKKADSDLICSTDAKALLNLVPQIKSNYKMLDIVCQSQHEMYWNVLKVLLTKFNVGHHDWEIYPLQRYIHGDCSKPLHVCVNQLRELKKSGR